MELAQGVGQALPLFIGQLAVPHLVLVDPPHGRKKTGGELGARHFHREDCHRQTALDRHVLGHIEGQRSLAHPRTSSQHDHVGGLKARGFFVQIRQAGGNPSNPGGRIPVVQLLNPIHHLSQNGLDGHKAAGGTCTGLGNLEHLGLRLIQQGLGVLAGRRQGAGSDLIAYRHQFAKNCTFTDDFAIAAYVCGRWRTVGDFSQIGEAAHVFGFAILFEGLIHRNHVGRLAHFDQLGDLPEDTAMVIPVEVHLIDDVPHPLPDRVVDQQAANQRLLRLDGVRGQPQGGHGGIFVGGGILAHGGLTGRTAQGRLD